ncbi:hypothetical protein ADUPG1_010918, partial [Aduncisulcus paluster]
MRQVNKSVLTTESSVDTRRRRAKMAVALRKEKRSQLLKSRRSARTQSQASSSSVGSHHAVEKSFQEIQRIDTHLAN